MQERYSKVFFCYVDDSAKMYKKAIFNPRPSKFKIFGLVTKSPTYTGLIGVQDIEVLCCLIQKITLIPSFFGERVLKETHVRTCFV